MEQVQRRTVVVGVGIVLSIVACVLLVGPFSGVSPVEDLGIGMGLVNHRAMARAAKLALERQFKSEDRELDAKLGVLAHRTGFAGSGIAALGIDEDSEDRWSKASALNRLTLKSQHQDSSQVLATSDRDGDPTSALLQLDASSSPSTSGSSFPMLLQHKAQDTGAKQLLTWANTIQNYAEKMNAEGLSPNVPPSSNISPGHHTSRVASKERVSDGEGKGPAELVRTTSKQSGVGEGGMSGLYGIGGIGPGEEEENGKDWVIAMHVDPNCREALKDLADHNIGALLLRGVNNTDCLPYKKKNPLMWPYGNPGEVWKELEDAIRRYKQTAVKGARDVRKDPAHTSEKAQRMAVRHPDSASLLPEMDAGVAGRHEEAMEREIGLLQEELRKAKNQVAEMKRQKRGEEGEEFVAQEDEKAEEREARRDEQATRRAEAAEEKEEEKGRAFWRSVEAERQAVSRVARQVVHLGERETALLMPLRSESDPPTQ